jgi:hypothetical protein
VEFGVGRSSHLDFMSKARLSNLRGCSRGPENGARVRMKQERCLAAQSSQARATTRFSLVGRSVDLFKREAVLCCCRATPHVASQIASQVVGYMQR